MQLRHLRVRNIRSYESAELEFAEGTTLLVGDVGSGKTSLLYAIEMALFGVAEVNGAYLVRHGARDAEVSVAFEEPGARYEISRRFRRLRRKGQETFEAEKIRFTTNGAETSYSSTELRQQVIRLLGFPDNPSPQARSDLWRWAVYVPQERMRDILGAQPQERLETVRKALGVERYRTAAENAQELAKDLRRTAGSRRNEADRLRHFEDEHAEAEALGAALRSERVGLEQSLRIAEEEVERLRAERGRLERELRTFEGDQRELVGLEREAESSRNALAERDRLLAENASGLRQRESEFASATHDAEPLERLRRSIEELDAELAVARSKLERQAMALRSLAEAQAVSASLARQERETRASLELLKREESEAGRDLAEVNAEGPGKEPPAPTPDPVPAIDLRLTKAREEEATALQSLAREEAALREMESLIEHGVCPTCHQSVRADDFATHRAEAQSSVETARARLAECTSERTRLEETRRARERYDRALDRWKEVEKRRAVARTHLDRAASAREDSARQLDRLTREAAASAERVTELMPAESEGTALRTALSQLEARLRERSTEVEAASRAEERRIGIQRSIELLSNERARLERESREVRASLSKTLRQAEQLRTALERAQPLREAAEKLAPQVAAAENAGGERRNALARLDTRLEEANRRVRAAEAGRREREALLAEAADLDEKAVWVGTHFRATVLGMEAKLLSHAQALFEREFARYFSSLVDDPALIVRTDAAFTPAALIEGEWTPAEALSGGERTSLALAFRLALAHVVRALGSLRLDTMLLDEPTDGFSPEQVIRMGELLEELALPQVILVSHEAQLAAIADRVVRVEKVNGSSVLATDSAGPGPPPSAPTKLVDAA